MSEGSLSIVLDRLAFEPNDTLRGSYQLIPAELGRVEEVEVTICWHTEGKGRQARGVELRRVHRPGDDSLDANGSGRFSAILPASPLSYEGVLIKVCWTVHVRARFPGLVQLDSEEAFQLGHVARVVDDSTSRARQDVVALDADEPDSAPGDNVGQNPGSEPIGES